MTLPPDPCAGPTTVCVLDLTAAPGVQLADTPAARALAAELVARASRGAEALELALAALADREAGATFAVAVGSAVRRGVPTAQRASVVARVPTTGRLADGQVGGDLGARLAGRADLVVLLGSARPAQTPEAAGARPAAVCLVLGDGPPRLEQVPGLAGAAPAAKADLLRRALGGAAAPSVGGLCIGPAGEALAPLANLANLAAPGEPLSYVGRGGLGAAFGATGLAALAVLYGPLAPARDGAAERLRAALTASPRLVLRAMGGTHERAAELAARGAPGAAAAERAAALAEEARAGRHGCRGCPTPCGWVLDGGPGPVRGARFGALAHLAELAPPPMPAGQPAGQVSGPPTPDPRRLLARCDDLGLDAKGAALAVARLAPLAPAEALALLAAGRARAEQLAALFDGRAPDQADDPLHRLARRVAGPGRDPLRVGLALADADPARIAAALAPLPYTPGQHGRLVWWHECLAAALDAVGFCAFSAAGLLADGVLTLDNLAAAVLPPDPDSGVGAAAPGAALLDLGRRLVRARWQLAPARARLARDPADPLEAPGLLPDYRAAAGLDPDGRPLPSADPAPAHRPWEPQGEGPPPGGTTARGHHSLGATQGGPQDLVPPSPEPQLIGPGSVRPSPSDLTPAADPPAPNRAPALPQFAGPGPWVGLRVGGAWAGRLGLEHGAILKLPLTPPATVTAALTTAATQHPSAAPWLLRDGLPLPAVYRRGQRLSATAPLADGDVLDLVLVIAGG